jgi:hypothetical protein
LDEIKKEEDELYANRSQLFEERTSMQQQLDALFAERCESSVRFCEANDRYYENLNGDQARRAERRRAQEEAEEEEKQKVCVLQLWEEPSQPVFQLQIEDCQTLINFFSVKWTTTIVLRAAAALRVMEHVVWEREITRLGLGAALGRVRAASFCPRPWPQHAGLQQHTRG